MYMKANKNGNTRQTKREEEKNHWKQNNKLLNRISYFRRIFSWLFIRHLFFFWSLVINLRHHFDDISVKIVFINLNSFCSISFFFFSSSIFYFVMLNRTHSSTQFQIWFHKSQSVKFIFIATNKCQKTYRTERSENYKKKHLPFIFERLKFTNENN